MQNSQNAHPRLGPAEQEMLWRLKVSEQMAATKAELRYFREDRNRVRNLELSMVKMRGDISNLRFLVKIIIFAMLTLAGGGATWSDVISLLGGL